MEKAAMRFLNLLANKFFAITFSWLLGQNIRDTLCGTKVFFKEDYIKIKSNRNYFGDFDPFSASLTDAQFAPITGTVGLRDTPVRADALGLSPLLVFLR